MAGLTEEMKNRITEILNATRHTRQGFTVVYDDESNPVATIAFSGGTEYRFVISSTENGAFTTSECPGIHLDEAEIFQRSNLDLCITAVKDWSKRIIERQQDSILDEFGGVADSDPSYFGH